MARDPEKRRASKRADYWRNKEKRKVTARKWWHDLSSKRKRLHSVRSRAQRKGLPFNLTLEDLVGDTCPILGFPLDWNDEKSEFSAEVDRIVPARGYVKGNVRIVSRRANRIKDNASLYELERLVSYVRESLGCP